MKVRRPLSVLPLAALLAAAGCDTEIVNTSHVIYAHAQGGPDESALFVAFSSTASSYDAAEELLSTDANPTQYHILLDGNRVSVGVDDGSGLWVTEGSQVGTSYLPAGPYHVTLVAPGAAPIFEGDAQLPGGGAMVLLLYGPLDALAGRFLSLPGAAASGNEHVTVVNLMRDGRAIQVVSCTSVPPCTPLSSALALGDVYDAELPSGISDDCAAPRAAEVPCPSTLSRGGVGVGYGLVPSASLPAPPVLGLAPAAWPGAPDTGTSTVFLAAPVFMTDQGQPETVIN
ncbi:MAG TPA: hypothetical protein VKZ18_16115 [Polyangia bacterium]|nr:hypothetical protein [Polyangia bacterium]